MWSAGLNSFSESVRTILDQALEILVICLNIRNKNLLSIYGPGNGFSTDFRKIQGFNTFLVHQDMNKDLGGKVPYMQSSV